MAACTASYAADQWGTPTYGGPEYIWTGAAGDNQYTTGENWQGGAAPSRTATQGPVLIFDGVTATVQGDAQNSSDAGGIKAINGSVVSGASLGEWGGAIYVEEGSSLVTSLGHQLKNTEAADKANVYVGGSLTIASAYYNRLDFQDGNSWQNWQIDTNGKVDISAMTEILKKDSWNLQYLAKGIGPGGATDVKNRDYSTQSRSEQIITSSINLNGLFNSVEVIDKRSGLAVDSSLYALTYGESGNVSISYTEELYSYASLETSGDITWAHGASGWTISGGDGVDTSFLNGDTVKITGNGTAALQGDVRVADLTVNSGVDYTVNMAANSSLTVNAVKENFAGIKVVGDSTTTLNLNISSSAAAGGDGRVVLAEGSSVGRVNVGSFFAYNLNYGAVSSNVGGADLHLNDGAVLLIRNGISGKVDANIKDIYFDGANAELRVYGSVSSSEIADNIHASSTILKKTDGGAVSLSGGVTAKDILVEGGSLNLTGTANVTGQIKVGGGKMDISGTASTDKLYVGGNDLNITGTVTASQLRLKEQGGGVVTVGRGGELNITGTENGHGVNASILLAHWGDWYGNMNTGLLVDGGTLNANGAVVKAGWSSAGFMEVRSGEANVQGISFWGQSDNMSGKLILGSDTGDGSARLNIGASGMSDCSNEVELIFRNGTIGATANWTLNCNPDASRFPAVAVNLTGTGAGTIFDTTDAVDKTTARTITISNPVAGTGKLVKVGDGTLKITGAMTGFSGSVDVQKGLVDLAGAEAVTLAGVTVADGAELRIGAQAAGTVGATAATLAGGATVTGNLDLSNATTLTLDGLGNKVVTVTGVLSLNPGENLTLSGDVLTAIAGLGNGEQLNLFAAASYTLPESVLRSTGDAGVQQWAIAEVFGGNTWASGNELYVGYDGAYLYVINNAAPIPEPTTATLSLLALAALASRRRRK